MCGQKIDPVTRTCGVGFWFCWLYYGCRFQNQSDANGKPIRAYQSDGWYWSTSIAISILFPVIGFFIMFGYPFFYTFKVTYYYCWTCCGQNDNSGMVSLLALPFYIIFGMVLWALMEGFIFGFCYWTSILYAYAVPCIYLKAPLKR